MAAVEVDSAAAAVEAEVAAAALVAVDSAEAGVAVDSAAEEEEALVEAAVVVVALEVNLRLGGDIWSATNVLILQ